MVVPNGRGLAPPFRSSFQAYCTRSPELEATPKIGVIRAPAPL